LLDANVLIALAWPKHGAHEKVGLWFRRQSRSGWATCPFTQAAFVRLLSNPAFSPNALTPQDALKVLDDNLKLPGHHFWPVDISVAEAIESVGRRLTGHRQVTDAYLLGLAVHHRGKLATLDSGMEGMGVPGLVEMVN
jgi:hypothetical protein